MNNSFEKEIINYEKSIDIYSYKSKRGKTPIMFTAVHTVEQQKEDGIKHPEPFTSAICQYVGNKIDCSYLIKSIDNGIDSNSVIMDEFKELLLKYIKENNIKLLIDVHGASISRDFDVEIGTLSNLTADLITQNTLVDYLKEQGIENIDINNKFTGGGITKYIFKNTDIDVIQLEINYRFRDIENLKECEKLCNALIDFSKKYANFN